MTVDPKVARRPESGSEQPSREALVASLHDADGDVRKEAREALTAIGGPVVPLLLPLLRDARVDVRWEAARVLADVADSRAAAPLVRVLEDVDPGVRWLAATGLIAIGHEALAPLLHRLIEHSGSVWLRDGAHHVLHDMMRGDLDAVLGRIVTALEGISPDITVIERAYDALHAIER